MPFQNEILDLLSDCCTGLGIPPPDSFSFPVMCVIQRPLDPSPNQRRRAPSCKVLFCQIKFEWIGGMTTIPGEWIRKRTWFLSGPCPSFQEQPVTRGSSCIRHRSDLSWNVSYITRLDPPREDLAGLDIIWLLPHLD